ncbi:DUF1876 domain-containing protein [Streptomyces sp. NPDC002580]|uniref:DUF1876 domain-containing protein n=1 Tax=Streptomyces sp. NPDC002580 TaxID=3364653 RepID=UPI003696FCB0
MSHTRQWNVRLHLFEDDGATKARVVLDTGTTTLTGRGTAHCSPEDTNVPEIGDELAAGRAMDDLAHQLLNVALRDVEGMSPHRPITPAPLGWPA